MGFGFQYAVSPCDGVDVALGAVVYFIVTARIKLC